MRASTGGLLAIVTAVSLGTALPAYGGTGAPGPDTKGAASAPAAPAVGQKTPAPAVAPAKEAPPPGKKAPATRQFANLAYPGLGNIQFDEGTLEMWVISDLDFDNKSAGGTVFDIRFLDGSADHYGMVYLSHHFAFVGWVKPRQQNYVWTEPLNWKMKEAHHIALTWKGRSRSFYIDGRIPPPNTVPGDSLQGPGRPDTSENVVVEDWLHGDITVTQLCLGLSYTPLTVDEIRISSIARSVEEIHQQIAAGPVADVYTLLLDHCDGGPAEVISGLSGEKGGTLSGAYRIVDTPHGKGIALWSEIAK